MPTRVLLPFGLKGRPFSLKELLPFCLVPGPQSEVFGQLHGIATDSSMTHEINPCHAQLVSIPKRHPYTRNLNSETSGDGENRFLHCGDVLALHGCCGEFGYDLG